MAKNRAQVSLIIPRDDVFEDLIQPLKRERRLTDLVGRLLERYYDSEEIRRLVDADELEVSEDFVPEQDMYTSINESIAAMDFLVQEGRNAVEDGADVFETIIEGGKKAGIFKESGDDVSSGVSFVNHDIIQPKQIGVSEEASTNSEDTTDNDRVTKLESELSEMKEMLFNLQSMMQNNMMQQPSFKNDEAPTSEISKVNSNDDRSFVENKSTENNDDSDIDIDLEEEEQVYKPVENSTASLKSLLSSL